MGAEPPDAQVCSLTAESVARPRPLCVLARRTGRRATIPALARNKMYPKRTMNEHEARKTPVFAAVERGGRVVATVIPDSRDTHRHVREFVLPRSVVYTDDWKGYMPLRDAYKHRRINHSAKIYVSGDVHTQTIDRPQAIASRCRMLACPSAAYSVSVRLRCCQSNEQAAM